MFGRKRKWEPEIPFYPETQLAVMKCSICNGEKVAGFQDKDTGKFHEVMLVRNEDDLQLFQQMYGLTEVKKIY